MPTRVAVCIASYNMARFLPELLHSLEVQTFSDFRVYVSYNGSTDDTAELLNAYGGHLNLFIVPYNPIPGIGLNKHDAVATALEDEPEYIQMIDADDIVLPRFLEAVVERMDRGDVDWSICWGSLFGDRKGYIHSEIEPLEKLLLHNNLHSWGTFRASMLRVLQYNPKLTYAEDWDLWIRLTQAGYKGDTVHEELYLKRWHDENLTTINAVASIVPVQPRKKFRFHLLGLAHLPQSKIYNSCAFTQKNLKLSQMLHSLGHEVFFYGSEGSDVECTRFVQTHTIKDIRQDYGDGDNRFEIGYDWTDADFRHDFNAETRNPSTVKYYNSCIAQINGWKRDDDFLLLTQGAYQRPILDAVKFYLSCEPGIGYRGSINLCWRAFESSYIQNFTYGSEHPRESINGNYYDRVIPNYFDPVDFEFSSEKGDYFLYIGRMIIRKGLLTAYKATQAIGARLVIAGQGAHIDGRGYLIPNKDPEFELPPGNWNYIGFASIEQRKKLMAHARATFVATEYLEPFAGVHVESMLSGTPVLTTNFGVFPETFKDGVDGYHCNTLDDFVWAAKNIDKLDPHDIRKHAERYLMDNVKWEYQRWFEDLYQLYLSTKGNNAKGFNHIREEEPEWRKRASNELCLVL